MIRLSNQHSFEHMAASGALAYDGRGWPWEWPLRWMGLIDPRLFTIVTKTLTYAPRKGNLNWAHPWTCVKVLKSGVVNAVGLTNPGFDWWMDNVADKIHATNYSIVCSITEDDPQKLSEMVKRLERVSVVAIELNASCPNTDQELHHNVDAVVESAKLMKAQSRHPIILKLSVNQDYLSIAKQTEGVVEALSINSVPWRIAFPEEKSPLADLGGGGVSGRVAQAFTWKMVRELASNVKTPVIGPSVWNFEDIQKLRDLGSKAISFGSIFMRYPWRPTQYVKKDKRNN